MNFHSSLGPAGSVRRNGLRGVTLMAALALSAAACTGGQHSSADSSSAGSSSASKSASSSTVTGAPAASPTRPSAVDTVSVAVAKRSRDQVTLLHSLAVNAGHAGGIPASQIPLSAKQIDAQLKSQAQACAVLRPAASSPAGQLTASLTKYETLAIQLADWSPAAGKPLPDSYFTQLTAVDTSWKSALQALGRSSHSDLLTGMAPLLLPKK